MRTIGPWTLALLALATPGWAADIYRWTDGAGNVHYSNMDAEGDDAASVARDAPVAPPDEEASLNDATGDTADDAAGGTTAPADPSAFSTDASLRRNALERDLRATQQRLHEVDAHLAALARARGQHAQGSAATGGVATPTAAPEGIDLRSEEERTLATEREQLAQHADQVRDQAAKLREEVTARLGVTPPWWIDLRSEEERTLAAEREQLAQHADQVRDQAAKLREEVTARLGVTPPWWIDLR